MDPLLYRLRSAVADLMDIVLPRSDRRARAERLVPAVLSLSPETHTMLGKDVTTLGMYADLKDPIQALKYEKSVRCANVLADILSDFLREEIHSFKQYSRKEVLLVPVPLDAKRKRDRGYNQIGLVTDALPEEFKNGTLSRVASPLLERTRETKQQTLLTRSARLSNVAGAFAVADPSLVAGKLVYVIDDVATTGATLVHAARPLEESGAEVRLLALARA